MWCRRENERHEQGKHRYRFGPPFAGLQHRVLGYPSTHWGVAKFVRGPEIRSAQSEEENGLKLKSSSPFWGTNNESEEASSEAIMPSLPPSRYDTCCSGTDPAGKSSKNQPVVCGGSKGPIDEVSRLADAMISISLSLDEENNPMLGSNSGSGGLLYEASESSKSEESRLLIECICRSVGSSIWSPRSILLELLDKKGLLSAIAPPIMGKSNRAESSRDQCILIIESALEEVEVECQWKRLRRWMYVSRLYKETDHELSVPSQLLMLSTYIPSSSLHELIVFLSRAIIVIKPAWIS